MYNKKLITKENKNIFINSYIVSKLFLKWIVMLIIDCILSRNVGLDSYAITVYIYSRLVYKYEKYSNQHKQSFKYIKCKLYEQYKV